MPTPHNGAGSGCIDGLALLDGTVIESPACVSTRADMSPCAPPMKPLSPSQSYQKGDSQSPLPSPFLGELATHDNTLEAIFCCSAACSPWTLFYRGVHLQNLLPAPFVAEFPK